MCVCVKTFSEICKYKALKDARELEFFCIAELLVIFVCLIISFLFFLIGLACSDPHPPNLGGEGEKLGAKVSNKF